MNWDLRAAGEKMAREQKERREKETAKKIERERIAARVQAEAARRQESSSNSSFVYRHRNVNPSPREDNFIPLEMKTSCRIEQTTSKMDEVVNEAATLKKLIKLANLAEVIVTYLYNRKTQNDNFVPLKMKPRFSEENEGKKDELVDDAAAFELFSKLAKERSDELVNDAAAYEIVLKLMKAPTQGSCHESEAKENKDDDDDGDDDGDELDKKKDGKDFLKRKATLNPSLEMPKFTLPESVIEYKTTTNQNTEESATKNIIRRVQPPSSTSGVPTRKIAELAEQEAQGNRNESNGDKKVFLKQSSSASVTSTMHIVDRNRDDNNGFNKDHKKSYAEAVMCTERPRTEKEGGYTNKGTNIPPFQLPESPLEFLSMRYIPSRYLPSRYLPQCSNSETLTGHPSDDQEAKTGEIGTRTSKPPFRLPESPLEFLSRKYILRTYLPQCFNSEHLTGHSSGSDDQEVKTGEIGMSNNRNKTEEVCPHSRIDHDLDGSRTSKPSLHSSKYSIRDILSRNQPRSSTSKISTRHTAWPNNRGKEKKWIDDRHGNNFYKFKGFRSSESSNRAITDRFWTKERNLKQLPSPSGTSSGDYSTEKMQRVRNRKKIDITPVLKYLELRQSSTYEEKKKEEKEKHCGGERSERKDGDSDEDDNGSVS